QGEVETGPWVAVGTRFRLILSATDEQLAGHDMTAGPCSPDSADCRVGGGATRDASAPDRGDDLAGSAGRRRNAWHARTAAWSRGVSSAIPQAAPGSCDGGVPACLRGS